MFASMGYRAGACADTQVCAAVRVFTAFGSQEFVGVRAAPFLAGSLLGFSETTLAVQYRAGVSAHVTLCVVRHQHGGRRSLSRSVTGRTNNGVFL
ncbi:unnamed protein product [Arctia plantaginis]|uniref:Uncharacterized protein n=1 Tax=Arctia plantaginis TaxID=874455 RepID=A0A8S0ZRB2_ARCPL|nr:unnamed protein product [Arctia plantaginis]